MGAGDNTVSRFAATETVRSNGCAIPTCLGDTEIRKNKHDCDNDADDNEYPAPSDGLDDGCRYQGDEILSAKEEHGVDSKSKCTFVEEEDLVSILWDEIPRQWMMMGDIHRETRRYQLSFVR